MGSEGQLGTIWEVGLEGRLWVYSEVNLRSILDHILGNLINILNIRFLGPWVGP